MFNGINIIAIHETTTLYEAVTFFMTSITSAGTYKINPTNCQAGISIDGSDHGTGQDSTKEYGSVKITELGNGRIAGTFTAIVYPDADVTRPFMAVTSGSFDIALPD